MMREGKTLRRRGVAVVALMIALCVGAPELVESAGAATPRPAARTELQARVSTRPAQQQPTKIQRARARRRALRAANKRKRTRSTKKRRGKRKVKRGKKKVKRKAKRAKRGKLTIKQKRNRAKAKRAKNRKKSGAAAGKKGKGGGLSLMGWAEILFFVLLPFLAVAALLFGTDYQRKPRAPSRTKRKRSLVITPVSRKF
jgi:hypothetical protein